MACRPLPINVSPRLTSHCAGRCGCGSHGYVVPPRLPALLQGPRSRRGRFRRPVRVTRPADDTRWIFAVGGLDGSCSVVLVSQARFSTTHSLRPCVKLTSNWHRIRAVHCLGDYLEGTFQMTSVALRLSGALFKACRVTANAFASRTLSSLRSSVIPTRSLRRSSFAHYHVQHAVEPFHNNIRLS